MKYLPHLELIDEQHDDMVSLLTSWANIHSGSENLQGLLEMFSALEHAFASLGGNMEKICREPNHWVYGGQEPRPQCYLAPTGPKVDNVLVFGQSGICAF